MFCHKLKLLFVAVDVKSCYGEEITLLVVIKFTP